MNIGGNDVDDFVELYIRGLGYKGKFDYLQVKEILYREEDFEVYRFNCSDSFSFEMPDG